MDTPNPTAHSRFATTLASAVPKSTPLALTNSHLIGPFDNTDLVGLQTAYPPESAVDLEAYYPGRTGTVAWMRAASLDGVAPSAVDLDEWIPNVPDSVVYYYAEVVCETARIAHLSLEASGFINAWANGARMIAPTIPESAKPQDHAAWIALQPGRNTILVKVMFHGLHEQKLGCHLKGYGTSAETVQAIMALIAPTQDPGIRLMAHMICAEVLGASRDAPGCRRALDNIRSDPYATVWDAAWAEAVERQYQDTGRFTPFHDVAVQYQPVDDPQPYPAFWPQTMHPAGELLVVDVSHASPQVEFALAVLQGLVNRTQPRLYLLHTRYEVQDRQWLDELHVEGFRSTPITVEEAWQRFKSEVTGAVVYDGGIMDEIGDVYSDRLNQTNVLMMIGALENAVPVTPDMNAALGLPVVFDARNRWSNQYDMLRWAYVELFPRMNHRLLATNYPGIFLITDYLVCFKVFTFWFPEFRTTLEENLLRGILASTPPNSPILGWWFDWMPNPRDGKRRDADAVAEEPGLLRGSFFGKILTPSHEATNLTVHSSVPAGAWRHKDPARPEYDPAKIYYTFMISDGDNMGEALMMRTRALQWDKPERGTFPMGWSFAPATSRLAPPVLSYYLRTASPNDVLMGGLGVGYTEPMIYLRAYPAQRSNLWAQYAREVDRAMGWIDTTCLWLIDGRHEEDDRYARGSSGQLRSIFVGYGGRPEIAEARLAPNGVVAFRSATRFPTVKTREEKIQQMVDDIRAATRSRPDFIEAWVLNWGLEMSMLQEVQAQLGPDYVCVRPDVLAELRIRAAS